MCLVPGGVCSGMVPPPRGCLVLGGCLLQGVCVSALLGVSARGVSAPWGSAPGGWRPSPPRDGYCCGRYASYWNAFLLQLQFNLFVLLCRDTLIPSSLPEANITRYDVRWTETGIDPAKSKGNINAFLFISQTKFMAICTVGQIIKLQPLDFKTRMHSSRMRTAHLLTVSRSIPCVSGGGGEGLPNSPGCRPPWRQSPWMQTPLEAYPLPLDADPPGHVTCDVCWEANPPGQKE